MEYDVITFDTQTVEHNSYHFDGGLLSQLKQFKNGPIQVVVSEIVARELLKHLIDRTRQANDSLATAHKKAMDTGLPSSYRPISNDEIKATAQARLTKFLSEIGAQIIPANIASMTDLVSQYFRPAPPFAAAGKNKSEFPDAIALLSLSKWAETNDKSIIASSNDKGWSAFAAGHPKIDVVSDLADALALLQEHKEEAQDTVKKLFFAISNGSEPTLSARFDKLLSDAVASHSVYAEGNSAYTLEGDDVDLDLQEYDLPGDPDDLEFELVQIGPKTIVARLNVDVRLAARTSFSMSIYDSIDKDYTSVGSTSATTTTTETFEILVTFEKDDSTKFSITNVEIVNGPTSIDFGDVEPDYEPDYDEDYFEPQEDDPNQA